MSKLYQFTSIFIVIVFFTGCGGSTTITKDTDSSDNTRTVDSSAIATMSTAEKIDHAEKLFASALSLSSRNHSEKNTLLTNGLLLCTQILTDYHQLKLSRDLTAVDISPEQLDYSLQLTNKIMAQLNSAQLTQEQKNQYLLASAAISLTNYLAEKTLTQLNITFVSTQNELWSLYYQLRAMADYQLGQPSIAVKELIIRHDYLLSDKEKQSNLNLIWRYLARINVNEQTQKNLLSLSTDNRTISNSDNIYFGWIELAKIIRASKNPQIMNNAVNFWLQSHPSHQADRAFINHIIQIRQASIITVRHIAVLLPAQGKLEKPAKAIRDGIMASHYKSSLSADIQLRFYDTGNGDHIGLTYQKAIDNGADFIIGPLAKSNVEVLSDSAQISVPTLALNSLEPVSIEAVNNLEAESSTEPNSSLELNNSPEPNNSPERNNSAELANSSEQQSTPEADNISASGQLPTGKSEYLFQFGLSPESSARMVAEKARLDGHYYAAVMTPDSSWGKRMKNAFSAHWEKLGGVVADTVAYKSKEHDFSESIKSMLNINLSESRKKEVSRTIGRKVEFTPRRRQDIDMLFMAAFPRQAKQIPLQVIYHHGETIPIYSTAHIVANYHNARQNIDMDGVNFSDMPFLLGDAQDTASQQNTYQSTLYQRLFAMGVDSYQLAPYVNYLYQNPSESFSGDTGQLTINHDGHIIRSLPWATFNQGNIKLLNPSVVTNNITFSNIISNSNF